MAHTHIASCQLPAHVQSLCDLLAMATLAGNRSQVEELYGALVEFAPGGDEFAAACTCHYPG